MDIIAEIIHWIRQKVIWIIEKISGVVPDPVNAQLVAAQLVLIEHEESSAEAEASHPAVVNADEDPECKKDVENDFKEVFTVTAVENGSERMEEVSTATAVEDGPEQLEVSTATAVEDRPKQMEEVSTTSVVEDGPEQMEEVSTATAVERVRKQLEEVSNAHDNVDKFQDESPQKASIVLKEMLGMPINEYELKLADLSIEEIKTVRTTSLDSFVENYHSSEDESFDIKKTQSNYLYF